MKNKMLDIYEYFVKNLQDTTWTTLLLAKPFVSSFPFMDDYVNKGYGGTIERTLMYSAIGDLYYHSNYDEERGLDFKCSDISNMFIGMLHMNEYKYKTLYATMGFDYNPIENYSMVEHGTDITDPTTQTLGEHITTDSGKSDTFTIGQKVDVDSGTQLTDVMGQKKNTNVYGQTESNNTVESRQKTQTTDTEYVTGYNSSSPVISNKHIIENETDNTSNANKVTTLDTSKTHTDTITTDSYTDTHTQGQRTYTNGSQTNTSQLGDSSITYGEQINTNGEVKVTHDFTRSGNIGVMSAQDMINQERNVALFSFYQIIWDDFLELITIPSWDYDERY